MNYQFPELECSYIGKKLVFMGASDIQVNYCGRHDPREFLTVGETYTVSDANVGGWSTTLEFKEFPGKTFNSVCFEEEA